MMRTAGGATLALIASLAAASQTVEAAETARYRVTVEVDWRRESHAADYPANAHWSRLVAVAHTSRYRLFADGETASSGLALLATNGRATVLEAELKEARRRHRVAAQIIVPGLSSGTGAFEFELPSASPPP